MTRLDIQLLFKGQCAQAFKFYKKCLGSKVDFTMKYGDAPKADQGPPEMHDKILHTSMKVGNATLMGSDAPPGHDDKPQGFAASLGIDDPSEAERVFKALSEGGEVTAPMKETFWAKRFGMLTDKFGTPWMVNCSKPM
jgi:PhnB protein